MVILTLSTLVSLPLAVVAVVATIALPLLWCCRCRPVFQFVSVLLFTVVVAGRSSMWRLTPMVHVAGSTGLSVSILLLLSESHGLPRSHFVALDRTSSFKLPSGNASSTGVPVALL
jgi:hypothetical protein